MRADRSGRYWTPALVGHGTTAVGVRALAVTPFLDGAGLALACALTLAERTDTPLVALVLLLVRPLRVRGSEAPARR